VNILSIRYSVQLDSIPLYKITILLQLQCIVKKNFGEKFQCACEVLVAIVVCLSNLCS